ncbi:MAG: molybdopterin molybdotransferase MoeA [Desulfosalsimonadaceae bacterium]
MTKEFFSVTPVETVFEYLSGFSRTDVEKIGLLDAGGRVLAEQIVSDIDLPGFDRSTMDGYAVRASDTFGASESNPAYLDICGSIAMGQKPDVTLSSGKAARIATGGMLPEGADAVMMIEHTSEIDDATIEVYRRLAPGTHVIQKDEDIRKNTLLLSPGRRLSPQETGIIAAMGKSVVRVHRKPVIGIISTGDEVVPADSIPETGCIRDINTYTLSAAIHLCGGEPRSYGIVGDRFDALLETAQKAVSESDMVIISGGSSVGTRDLTIEVIEALSGARIRVHGLPVRPGKPTILAEAGGKSIWGLPGHVASAMVIFEVFVKPCIRHIGGEAAPSGKHYRIPATLSRNLSSAQGRIDYVRVRIVEKDGAYFAEPILGPSGLIRTMLEADGLIKIGMNSEGLEKGANVLVMPFQS